MNTNKVELSGANPLTITLNKGGTEERSIELSKLTIPNAWHCQGANKREQELIRELWHIAHDLKRELLERHDP